MSELLPGRAPRTCHRRHYHASPVALSPEGSILALMLVVLVFAIPVLGLIGLYAAAPGRASTMPGSVRTRMRKHNRTITIVICFVFGAFFLVRGLSRA
jgi:hypothetical protein